MRTSSPVEGTEAAKKRSDVRFNAFSFHLQVLVDGMFFLAIDLDLLGQGEIGLIRITSVETRPDVLHGVEDFGRIRSWLLQAKLRNSLSLKLTLFD